MSGSIDAAPTSRAGYGDQRTSRVVISDAFGRSRHEPVRISPRTSHFIDALPRTTACGAQSTAARAPTRDGRGQTLATARHCQFVRNIGRTVCMIAGTAVRGY